MEPRYLTLLSADEQRGLGLDVPQTVAMADRVRYSELDTLNHVNNKAYMDWFEAIRARHFHHVCAPCFRGTPLPRTVLRNLSIHYLDEIRPAETYVVTARVTAFRNSSYTVDQQVWAGGTLRTRMQAVVVLLAPESASRHPLPSELRERFLRMDGAVDEN